MTDARGRRVESDRVAFNFVTPGWFDTYAMSRRAGRDISDADIAGSQRVAIVNEALIRKLFQNRSAVGETVKAGPCGQHGCTIVGVVSDAAYSPSLRDGAPPTLYLPFAQSAGLGPPGSQTFQVATRVSGEPARAVPAIEQALRAIDPALAFTFRPLAADVASALTQERLVASLASVFGLLALMLSALGLYGVVAYAVSRRRAEIGIRLALGAPPARIVRLVMRRVFLLGAVGMMLGLAVSLWLSRYVAPLVYGLEPSDPVTLITGALTLSAVGALASWIPASRAARLDPARVLRES
jgi:predicted lysophospholipase L1 biosynthesis ABC-type transport system permease subunit